MSTLVEKTKNYTFKEYLALEQEEKLRYEFYQGEVFAMAGGSKRHNILARRLAFVLESQAPDCEIFLNDVKLEFQKENYYVYPDLMLTCDKEDLADDTESIVRNPVLVAEVLSSSTESYDRGAKQKRYFKISSLQYYLLVSQEGSIVEVYERQNNFWKYFLYENLEDTIYLEKLNMNINLSEVYRRINFEEEKES